MSLDVYLTVPNTDRRCDPVDYIPVRENGAIRKLTRAEWDAKFPGVEPVTFHPEDGGDTTDVYWRNITHNLNKMADAAGIYKALWRPEELGITKAQQLIEPLRDGLALLKSDPATFKLFNPKNGWGDYDGLVDFVADYLRACVENPDADVVASR